MESSPLLLAFALTVAMSFLVGLALREYYVEQDHVDYFGSVRTYTFIGMLGFGLYQLEADVAYAAGLAGLAAFLTVYYWRKSAVGKPGMIGMLTALLTYLIGPLSLTVPAWFVILFVVSALFALNAKERIRTLSESITQREVVTLATFPTLAGVVLPLLPRETIAPWLPLTPYQIWLAIVVSTGISYASYLLRKFIFPSGGLLLSGFLGGLYSSTATTVTIARRTRDEGAAPLEIAAALTAPSSMMYLRMVVLVAIFDGDVSLRIAPLFLVLSGVTAGVAYWMSRRVPRTAGAASIRSESQRNPLELSSAALFAVLLVVMAVAARLALETWPELGLHAMAPIAGATEIEPFVISLLQMQPPLPPERIVQALVIATASNNILKAVCALVFARRDAAVPAAAVLIGVAALSLGYLLL
ncbi:MAG: MgtC/SapB family protein [Burkholderiales bacterium]